MSLKRTLRFYLKFVLITKDFVKNKIRTNEAENPQKNKNSPASGRIYLVLI